MPTFTPFLPRRQFLPRQAFYPNFTPFAILCAFRLPRFYPRGKTAHFLLVDTNKRTRCSIVVNVRMVTSIYRYELCLHAESGLGFARYPLLAHAPGREPWAQASAGVQCAVSHSIVVPYVSDNLALIHELQRCTIRI